MPDRTCIGCRAVLDKGLMVRLAAFEGRLTPDLAGKLGGRGVYVCSEKCLREACKRKDAFQRALKTKVEQPEPEAIWEKVRATGLKG